MNIEGEHKNPPPKMVVGDIVLTPTCIGTVTSIGEARIYIAPLRTGSRWVWSLLAPEFCMVLTKSQCL